MIEKPTRGAVSAASTSRTQSAKLSQDQSIRRSARLGEAGADPEADALDAVLVPVEAGEVLGEGLGQAVEGVGPVHHPGVGHRLDRMEADGVDRAGIDHPPGAVAAGALEDVVGGGQGVGDDLLEALLARVPGEMHDGVAVAGGRQRRGLVGEVAVARPPRAAPAAPRSAMSARRRWSARAAEAGRRWLPRLPAAPVIRMRR